MMLRSVIDLGVLCFTIHNGKICTERKGRNEMQAAGSQMSQRAILAWESLAMRRKDHDISEVER
jgi:glutamate synthase domain-containing protein 1